MEKNQERTLKALESIQKGISELKKTGNEEMASIFTRAFYSDEIFEGFIKLMSMKIDELKDFASKNS